MHEESIYETPFLNAQVSHSSISIERKLSLHILSDTHMLAWPLKKNWTTI